MKLAAVELLRTELPLVRAFRTSFGTETVREAILVRVEGPDGEGWGECVAGSEPLYSSEYVDAAWLTLRALDRPTAVRFRRSRCRAGSGSPGGSEGPPDGQGSH